jgi:hypothetical protein
VSLSRFESVTSGIQVSSIVTWAGQLSQRPREIDNSWAGQDIRRVLRISKVHHRVHKIQTLNLILRQLNHWIQSTYSRSISLRFILILSSVRHCLPSELVSGFATKILYAFLSSRIIVKKLPNRLLAFGGKPPDLYSGIVGFESRPGHRLSCVRCFVVFPSPSREIPGCYLDYAKTAYFQILPKSSFVYHRTIRPYKLETEKAWLGNPQKTASVV